MGRLGDTLRDRRHALGISLPRAEKALKIRIELLEALESGDYQSLPAPGYVRGYITSYARLLELDPQPLLSLYKSETGARRFSAANHPATKSPVAPLGMQHAVPVRGAIIVVAVIAAVALTSWLVWSILSGPDIDTTEPVPASSGSSKSTSSGPVVEEPTESPAPTRQFTLVVGVKADAVSWVSVKIDGKNAYSGTLVDGQKETFEVAGSAVVTMGKPEAVVITRDGKSIAVSRGKSSMTFNAAANR